MPYINFKTNCWFGYLYKVCDINRVGWQNPNNFVN